MKRRSKNYWGKGGGAVVAERSGKGVEVEEERRETERMTWHVLIYLLVCVRFFLWIFEAVVLFIESVPR